MIACSGAVQKMQYLCPVNYTDHHLVHVISDVERILLAENQIDNGTGPVFPVAHAPPISVLVSSMSNTPIRMEVLWFICSTFCVFQL